jgi:hypothetical protein
MNGFKKMEGFEDMNLMYIREQVSRDLSKYRMFQRLFLVLKLKDIYWQRREY